MAEVKLHPNSSLYALSSLLGNLVSGMGARSPVLDVHHPLRVSIAEIAVMRGTIVDLGFIERICDLVGKDASGEA
jgi:hypothetical protein